MGMMATLVQGNTRAVVRAAARRKSLSLVLSRYQPKHCQVTTDYTHSTLPCQSRKRPQGCQGCLLVLCSGESCLEVIHHSRGCLERPPGRGLHDVDIDGRPEESGGARYLNDLAAQTHRLVRLHHSQSARARRAFNNKVLTLSESD